eukprot:136874-Rhodomonas_salina.2
MQSCLILVQAIINTMCASEVGSTATRPTASHPLQQFTGSERLFCCWLHLREDRHSVGAFGGSLAHQAQGHHHYFPAAWCKCDGAVSGRGDSAPEQLLGRLSERSIAVGLRSAAHDKHLLHGKFAVRRARNKVSTHAYEHPFGTHTSELRKTTNSIVTGTGENFLFLWEAQISRDKIHEVSVIPNRAYEGALISNSTLCRGQAVPRVLDDVKMAAARANRGSQPSEL